MGQAVAISDFGDQAVILPLTAGTGLLLAVSGWRRGAIAWIVAIGGTLGLIVLLKFRFFACEDINPSGHTAAAAAVYGGLAGLVVGAIAKDRRAAVSCATVVAFSLAVMMGQSRVMLDTHSILEVSIGGAIGIGGAVGFVTLSGTPAQPIRIGNIVALGLVLVLLLHGARISAEEAIKLIAFQLWPSAQCL